ncbi:winged helix-turn-helix domain-containing protein [Bowmanella pacifica]|uniref:OmpR/PhoB-type domain-containing protein n=1 Tax=Bowmanella pacifica TaxID=502051 RepID=A0A918DFL6_9ALTE|nr:winged helix-turn-helix domain-containing protein [Bowmanella pacifica]GGO64080.1 hypothetical protein GCM10010982_02640 [Bowmanella pacifica]
MNSLAQNEIHLGKLTLCKQSRELRSHERKLALEPRVYELLLQMLSSPNFLVSRDQLIESVWQGRVVSDSAINRAVSQLRKNLAELDPGQDYIETIPKLGYRLKVVPAGPVTLPASKHSYRALFWLTGVALLTLIWWQSTEDKPTSIERLTIEDKKVQPLTGDDGIEFDVSLSADGQQLLYHKADTAGRIQLWHMQLQHAYQVSDTNTDKLAAKLSPDGQQVVYIEQDTDCQVMLAELTEQGVIAAPLFSCSEENGLRFTWMPDGKGFYYRFRQDKTHPFAIYMYRLDTSKSRQLTLPANISNGLGDIAMTVSHEGENLLVATYQGQQNTLLTTYRTKDMQAVNQHELAMGIKDIQWHSASSSLIISSGPYLHQWHNNVVSPLLYAGQSIQSFALAGQALVYSDNLQRSAIWQQSLSDTKTQPRINSSKLDLQPRLNHDGSQLAFISTRQGQHQIWLQVGLSEPRLLADLPAGFTRLSWRHDDSALLYTHLGAVYQVNASDGTTSKILPEQTQAYLVNPAPAGALLYSSIKSGDWQLWLWHPDSGHRQLTEHGGYSGWIKDGQLYYSKFHMAGLWQQDLNSGQATKLIEDFAVTNWLNWQLIQEGILYHRPEDGLYVFNPRTRETRLFLAQDADFVHQYSFANGVLLYVRLDTPQGDLYRLTLSPP